jgi:hypothetical protein
MSASTHLFSSAKPLLSHHHLSWPKCQPISVPVSCSSSTLVYLSTMIMTVPQIFTFCFVKQVHKEEFKKKERKELSMPLDICNTMHSCVFPLSWCVASHVWGSVHFDSKMFVCLTEILLEQYPNSKMYSDLINCQTFRRVIKLWTHNNKHKKNCSYFLQSTVIYVTPVSFLTIVCEVQII